MSVQPIGHKLTTFRELAEKIQELPEEMLDKPAKMHIPDDMREDYYPVGWLIVPSNGKDLGMPFMAIADGVYE